MADRIFEMDQQNIVKYRHHQGLVESLPRFLQTELNSNTFERDDHEAHKYHATIQYNPEQGVLHPIWHCNYCHLLFTYAKSYNRRIDNLYTQIRQLDQLRYPARANRMEMIQYLRPPFQQIPPDDMLAIIQTATRRYPSPILDKEEPPLLNQEQPRYEPHPNVVTIPNAEY
jgi:hypothetical protein